MYRWKKLTCEERKQVLSTRKAKRFPWHSPPHLSGNTNLYFITAACYEHKPVIGHSIQRISNFENEILNLLSSNKNNVLSWCILPNHYHLLLYTENLKQSNSILGRLHGKTSFQWNKEDDQRGRKCWYRISDRAIRSKRHKYATLNYIHNNPVHHKYVKKWQDWPFSSAKIFLDNVGKEKVMKIWNEYPILQYGKGWDDSEM